jgi:hypothetical protein
MKVFWDRAGRDSNVGREPRYIYIEWGDDPRARLLIDITWYYDDFIEKTVAPNLAEYFKRIPPVTVKWLGGDRYVKGECEFLVLDKSAKPFAIILKPPFDVIDHANFWRSITFARLHSYYRNFFLEVVEPQEDTVDIAVGNVAVLGVPRNIYEKWLVMKGRFESLMQQLLQLLEEERERAHPRELHVEFE